MSQSLFRLSINTARSIKITSNSSFCECLSCLLLKHCFQFRKICPFFFYICFCSRIFCTFQVILISVSTSTSTAIEHSSLRNPLDYIVGAPWGAKLNFNSFFLMLYAYAVWKRMCRFVHPVDCSRMCIALVFPFCGWHIAIFFTFCDTSQRVCRFFHQFSQRLSKLF